MKCITSLHLIKPWGETPKSDIKVSLTDTMRQYNTKVSHKKPYLANKINRHQYDSIRQRGIVLPGKHHLFINKVILHRYIRKRQYSNTSVREVLRRIVLLTLAVTWRFRRWEITCKCRTGRPPGECTRVTLGCPAHYTASHAHGFPKNGPGSEAHNLYTAYK